MVRAYSRRDYIRKILGSRIVQYYIENLSEEFPVSINLLLNL